MPDVTLAKPEPSKITWGPLAAVVVTVVVYFLSQIAATILLLSLAKAKGWSADEVQKQIGPQFIYILLVEAITLGLLWYYLKHQNANFKTLGLVRPQLADLAWVLTGFAIYLPILVAVMAGVKAWFPEVNMTQSQQIGFSGAHGTALILVFLSLVILPPITEEIVTRGFLFLGLRTKLPVVTAAIVTSLIFATAHLQFGSGAPLLWSAAIDTFVLSLVLIYLRVKTDRLWASIGLHMLKNGLAFMALFIFVK